MENYCHTFMAHNRSRIWCHSLKNYKRNHAIFGFLQLFDSVNVFVRKYIFSREQIEILRTEVKKFYVIFNLSLSRYDANFSKLDAKNLQESIKCNFTQVFFCSFLVLSTYFVNEIYFSLVIGNIRLHTSFVRGDYFFDNVRRIDKL